MSYSNGDKPNATNDLQCAKADMDDFGYCLLKGALSPDELAAIRTRLFEQKEAEERLALNITAKTKSN